jgi:hypothetical protein
VDNAACGRAGRQLDGKTIIESTHAFKLLKA